MKYIVIIIVVYLVINGIVASFMKNAAYAKGYDDNAHAFAMSFWLGVAGWLYVVALPDLVARENQERIIQILTNGSSSEEKRQDDLPDL